MDSVKNSLSDLVELFASRMSAFEAELQKAPTTPATTSSLATEFQTFRSFIMAALESLQQQVELLSRDVDRLEMRGWRKMLLVHNVAEANKEDASAVVLNVINAQLKLAGVSGGDIKRCHRVGRSADNKTRPILVKFADVTVRDKVWFSKTNLKGSGVTLSEFLTRERHAAFMEARERHSISKCWTRDGFVFVLTPDGVRHQITTLAELNKIPCSTTANASPVVPPAPQEPRTPKPAPLRSRRGTVKKY